MILIILFFNFRGPGDSERKSYDLTKSLPEEKLDNTI